MKTNIIEPNSLVIQENNQGLGLPFFPTSRQCYLRASFGHKIAPHIKFKLPMVDQERFHDYPIIVNCIGQEGFLNMFYAMF